MTKQSLLELYELLKSKNINPILISYLKNNSNEDINLIKESKYPDIVIRLLINNNFKIVHKELKYKLINIINNSQNKMIADYTSILIEDINVLMSGLVLELATIISNTEEEYQAINTLEVATNATILSTEQLNLKLIKMISKITNPYKSDCATKLLLTVSKNITVLNNLTEIIEHIINLIDSKTNEEVRIIYNNIITEIEKQKTDLNNPNAIFFWNKYQECSESTIAFLKNTTSNDTEIAPYTRIK
jgi:hypothetical protein